MPQCPKAGLAMKRILAIAVALLIAVPLLVIGIEVMKSPEQDHPGVPVADSAAQVARGAYLAQAGNCMACHTVHGGDEYAGGRAIRSRFGDIYAPNITPDEETGIGTWSADDFWRAMHNGKSRDGSFLYPAFPYPNYTKVSRADSDAIHAYLQTVLPVKQQNREHDLSFPYNQRILLAFWRTLYFEPGIYQPETNQSVDWNQGAYLVQGLGHCSACHTSRDAFGGSAGSDSFAGGMIPMQNWYAPSLHPDAGSGLAAWDAQDIAALLRTGVSRQGAVYGPMAEVVSASLQHLTQKDVDAMAVYLKSLPAQEAQRPAKAMAAHGNTDAVLELGAKIYEQHCVECHAANGKGQPPAYPPLAGNTSLTTGPAVNPIRMILSGGFPPSTDGNPRPYGMPPYSMTLSDEEIAAVLSYVRTAWGNQGSLVSSVEVGRLRGTPLE